MLESNSATNDACHGAMFLLAMKHTKLFSVGGVDVEQLV